MTLKFQNLVNQMVYGLLKIHDLQMSIVKRVTSCDLN